MNELKRNLMIYISKEKLPLLIYMIDFCQVFSPCYVLLPIRIAITMNFHLKTELKGYPFLIEHTEPMD